MRRTCTICKQEALFAGKNPIDKLHEDLNMCVKCQKVISRMVFDWGRA
jgi:hypothetical protein